MSSPHQSQRAMQAGVYLLCAWMWSLGWLVAGRMLFQGVDDWLLWTVHVATGPLALLAIAVGRRGHWGAVGVALVAFIWSAMALVHLGQGEYVVASLMNIAVLTLFAGWALGRWMTLLVIVACQVLLLRLVLDGVLAWNTAFPLMWTSLCLGVCMVLARRAYDRHMQLLLEGADQIAEHQAQRSMLSSVVEQSPYSIEVVDLEGKIIYANPTFLKQMGYDAQDVLGRRAREVSMNGLDEESFQAMRQHIRAGGVWRGVVRNQTQTGDTLTEQVMVTPIYDGDGLLRHFVQAKQDVSERVYAQARIDQLTNYDKLTLLPNSLALQRKLDDVMAQERNRLGREPNNHTQHLWHGLLLLNMDRFNQFNMVNGSEWGDALLVEVALRLQRWQADSQHIWIARYAADQFAVVLEHMGSNRAQAREQLRLQAQVLQNALTSVSLPNSTQDIPISFGVGMTVFPFIEPGLVADNSDRVIRRATLALAQAKRHGVKQLHAYSEHLAAEAEQYFHLERDLRQALLQDQLRLYVQPQYDKDAQVVGMEALVRWEHPVKGMIQPGQFIPVAESSGLIVEVGAWVLEQACALLNTPLMQQRGYSISVNISAQQFMQADFVSMIASVLERTQVLAQRLVLEVTESMLLADVQDAVQTMARLQAMGVQLALDDFGTGYSSLSYLRQLPIDELKIDQSFIRDLEPSGVSGALVQAVLMVAKELRLRVVAEGVENEGDAILLQAWDPAIVCQGYFYSKPMPCQAWLAVLAQTPADQAVGALSVV